MSVTFTPERWAFEITHILNAAYGADRFPIDIPTVAREYSKQRFPDDPIVNVKGDNLPKFDGALFRMPTRRVGWGIIYNDSIRSKGRINFTLAHEFGHYLLHRLAYPNGFRCGQQQIVRWDSEYGQLEHQANVFAANFLMPLDDFRRQIPSNAKVDFEMLRACAERYKVSLIATVLRWLDYTEKRAILVVSREGFILWARSSGPALRTGAFFKTSRGPIEIPPSSLPLNSKVLVDGRGQTDHPQGVWLREPAREMTILAEQYDFSRFCCSMMPALRILPNLSLNRTPMTSFNLQRVGESGKRRNRKPRVRVVFETGRVLTNRRFRFAWFRLCDNEENSVSVGIGQAKLKLSPRRAPQISPDHP